VKSPSPVIALLLASLFSLMCDSALAQAGQPSAGTEMPTEAEQLMFVKGQTLYNHGLYGEAIIILRESLDTFPNSSIKDLNLLWLGRSYLAQGDMTNAEKTGLRLRAIPDTALLGIYEEELRGARQNYAKAVTPSPVRKSEPVNKPDSKLRLHADKSQSTSPSPKPTVALATSTRPVEEPIKASSIVDLPSLRIRIEETPYANAANSAFSYRLVITNQGKGIAKDLTVRGELDASLDYAGSDPLPNRQELVAQKQVLTFRLPTIEPGATKVVQISVRSRRVGKLNIATQTKHSVIYRDCNGSFYHTP
jgi:hypothetical protein